MGQRKPCWEEKALMMQRRQRKYIRKGEAHARAPLYFRGSGSFRGARDRNFKLPRWRFFHMLGTWIFFNTVTISWTRSAFSRVCCSALMHPLGLQCLHLVFFLTDYSPFAFDSVEPCSFGWVSFQFQWKNVVSWAIRLETLSLSFHSWLCFSLLFTGDNVLDPDLGQG